MFSAINDSQHETKTECIDCQSQKEKSLKLTRENQKALSNQLCFTEYASVDECMKSNKGQVSKCVDEWKLFRMCRQNQK